MFGLCNTRSRYAQQKGTATIFYYPSARRFLGSLQIFNLSGK